MGQQNSLLPHALEILWQLPSALPPTKLGLAAITLGHLLTIPSVGPQPHGQVIFWVLHDFCRPLP